MPRTVVHELKQAFGLAHVFQDQSRDFQILHLLPEPDIIALPALSMMKHAVERRAVVRDMYPVSYVQTVPVNRERQSGEGVCDQEWNQFFRKLIGSIVV